MGTIARIELWVVQKIEEEGRRVRGASGSRRTLISRLEEYDLPRPRKR